ncbi:hypothetical protein RIF29_26793 [Crotalaria pallida]|uniref:Leucine-rich repeat-containing N-terminal plant-type domain-containing protein n=1 Tax=Crotalaria pallida TaxID=3830 RepID=A0AAN9ENP0_CROPI
MRIPLLPWLSFIFCHFCLILLSVDNITVVSGQCQGEQQSIMLQLKNNLKFKSEISTKLESWDESIDCCHWNGVNCDEKGHVTRLDLSGESIYGGFDNSSSLFNLQNLQFLNLATNSFNSLIPYGFNKLKNLTYLNLSYAGFVGQIPIEISQLTRLVTLDISSSYYLNNKPLILLDLGKLVRNLTRIRQLYLDGISITTAHGKEWSNALLQLPSLQELSMSSCNLSGPLYSSLSRLNNLSVIRLDQNKLSSSVPDTFANFRNLTVLHLSSCGLTGIFPKNIFRIATLSVIDISLNKDLHGSLPDFHSNGHLRILILRNTLFSGALPASIGNLSRLSILDLSYCHFNKTLPDSMSKLTELTQLDLSANNINGPIPPLNLSMNLSYLDLSHNGLTGSITSVHLEGLRKLVHIDLQDNVLNGSIPVSLFTLPMIRSIQLSNNSFEGLLDQFSNISSSSLETLDLCCNKLEGPIPVSIFHLRSLSVLQLSSNKFNGTIHLDMFHRLENLTTLDLSYNNLSIDTNVTEDFYFPNLINIKLASCNMSKFPIFFKNQSKLNILDLSNNHIQGSIPSWIWKFGSLSQLNLSHNLLTKLEEPVQTLSASKLYLYVLDLHSNQLQGKLPVIPRFTFYLDYSSNNFSSSIPSYFGTFLAFTIYLSLSKNNLSGSIPESLCNATNMQVLDVSYNRIEGTIPKCLAKSEALAVLNLQNNMLNGTIPDAFSESCALRTLDLRDNKLGGQIPVSLANCISLEVLDLGKNHIDDVFPCLLKKNLSSLRVMVLRDNKFHGHIGCPKINSTWPKLQIVDLAFNNFSGLLPGKILKTWEAMILDEDPGETKFDHIQFRFLNYSQLNYQDSVTITSKGQQMKFVKILTVFTSIDFSSNKLEGPIPEELMNFTGLYVLNLSRNAFTGQIPSSIGNLKQLESLDLSRNHFNGTLPTQLASLNFLSYLNLSFNNLVGKIPVGTQLQSFDATSFVGNRGLCGLPLPLICNSESSDEINKTEKVRAGSGGEFDWTFVTTGAGFGAGAGLIAAPLMFWERGKKWSNNIIDKILLFFLPMIGLTYTPLDHDDDDEEEEEEEEDKEKDIDVEGQDDLDCLWFQGRYCVSCSKVDMIRMKVMHDPRCTCYHSPTVFSISTYPQSYSS